MSKFLTTFVLTVLFVLAYGDEITPPDCSSGGGSATNVQVFVTDLSGNEPYSMSTNTNYNVTFTFIPSADAAAGSFAVTAAVTNLGGFLPIIPGFPLNIQVPISATSAGPYTAGQSAVTSLVFQIPGALSKSSALFQGVVKDGSGNVLACKQGNVKIQ